MSDPVQLPPGPALLYVESSGGLYSTPTCHDITAGDGPLDLNDRERLLLDALLKHAAIRNGGEA